MEKCGESLRELTFITPESYDGAKLRSFLRGYCRISCGILKRMKWIYNGIMVNGNHVYVTHILKTGDVVTLKLPETETQVMPADLPIRILWEDEDLLIVSKPSQMPVHPSPGHDCDSVANALCFHAEQRGESFSFHPVFRLDKNTSGLLVLAKNSFAASRLAFGVTKTYYAVCQGVLTGSGTINAPIRCKEGHGIQREVGEGPSSQTAVTNWEAVKNDSKHTLVKLHLETGRTHQIRVHFSYIGHPLAGDDLYGGSCELIARQALHCGEVRFIHPVTKEELQFHEPLPSDMNAIFKEDTLCQPSSATTSLQND